MSNRQSIVTPCVLVCVIHPSTGLCLGCYRTEVEIERWRSYSDAQRRGLMKALRQREKNAGGFTA
jgi:predicted Fe-S protein YdhL (DUF1289 family)